MEKNEDGTRPPDAMHKEPIALEGVPNALVLFLAEKFATLEAKFDARFDAVDESLRQLHTRVDDAQKALRKIRRSGLLDSPAQDRQHPFVSHRSADTIQPRIRRGAVRTSSLLFFSPSR